jgi:hypothetical protein
MPSSRKLQIIFAITIVTLIYIIVLQINFIESKVVSQATAHSDSLQMRNRNGRRENRPPVKVVPNKVLITIA